MKLSAIVLASLLGWPSSALAQSRESERQVPKKLDRTTVAGCLLEQNGEFVLVTKKRSTVLQLLATEELKGHVGHKVKITGTMENADQPQFDTTRTDKANPSIEASGRKQKNSSSEQGSGLHLRVEKVKLIATHCNVNSERDTEKSWGRILHL